MGQGFKPKQSFPKWGTNIIVFEETQHNDRRKHLQIEVRREQKIEQVEHPRLSTINKIDRKVTSQQNPQKGRLRINKRTNKKVRISLADDETKEAINNRLSIKMPLNKH